ncbi:MAG: thioredoxin-disulfide reductase [Alphaproteobacteria bacterium]
MTEHHLPLLIIGSGAAGLTSAIYAARANLKPTLITGMQTGGQLTITTDVENFPGFPDAVSGSELMSRIEQQARNVGASIINDTIIKADLSRRPFILTGDSGDIYNAEALIIATGASAKWLGIPSEKKFMGFGVSGCATCDGFFYRNKEVCVVGGGNTAVEEALYLANIASKVTLIHRRDELRAEKIMQKRLLENPKIEACWNSVVEEIIGDENPLGVTGVKVKNVKTQEISTIKADGVFIAIGHKPNTDAFKDFLKLDETGYIITEAKSTATSVKGVFAAGDVQDSKFRQAVTAAGTGCMAAIEADAFLAEN